jgi:polyphosphate kinase
MKKKFFDRDLSWLSFNARVLQEAADKTVPLLERLNFLVIYYTNLDDFMNTRIAPLMNLCDISDDEKKKLQKNPDKLLKKIRKKITKQQHEFNRIFNEEIHPELETRHIHLLTPEDLSESQKIFVKDYFNDKIKSQTESIVLNALTTRLRLRSDQLYMIADLQSEKNEQYGLVKIPSEISRLVNLPDKSEEHYLMILDDVVRLNLSSFFPRYSIGNAFSFLFKINASIYLRDEYHGAEIDALDKLLKADGNINSPGIVYDSDMPKSIVKFLRKKFKLKKNRCLSGGRYQRFSDFKNFPSFAQNDLQYKVVKPEETKHFPLGKSMFDCFAEKDVLLYYPYESYEPVLRLLDEAANSVSVDSIKISLYRVAKESKIINSLIKAAMNGKNVFVYDEVKASSDQEVNIYWSDLLSRNGIKVINGYKELKVHAKLLLIERMENDELKKYAYLSTGNFNESTAKFYTDFGLFSASEEITKDVALIFETLEKKSDEPQLLHLLISPSELRKGF